MLRFRVWCVGLGFGVWGLGFGVTSGLRVPSREESLKGSVKRSN